MSLLRITSAGAATALALLTSAVVHGPAAAAGGTDGAAATVGADWSRQSITFRAAPGQANDLQVMDMPGGGDVRRIAFNDEVPIRAGDHCVQPDPNDATRVVCELPVDGPRPDTIKVLLGDGDDMAFTESPGVSVVDGGAGNDELHAHSAHTVVGGSGDDMLMGGVVMLGGDGMDHLMGDARNQYLWGGAGDDHIEASGGDDIVYADSGDDHVAAGDGDDIVFGGRGDDTLHGEAGDDLLSGDSGDDILVGGPGTDRLWGGPGNDEITE
ncbi:calcium-binding protein [Streptomyces hainanensis]|uniref:Calcium-binding protein n=1 Tax=Streptomyces hainanensis TaxID=402648 RepID=A0A4R4TGG2_9ACTN|nr:calcium-binding protein [Streptomyces hainanensis]TDC74043.1 calcium-binding protein [Streptomyces hainanensis]